MFKFIFALFVTVGWFLTNVHAGESLFNLVGRMTVDAEEGLGGKLGPEEENVEPADSISAGLIWDDDKMKNLLGIVGGEDDLGEEATENQDDEQEVPSLLSAMYNKINEPGSKILPQKCKLPGMKGNVVRMLNNKGNILYQNEKYSILELQFSMKNALHEYENVTDALLKVSIPDVRSQYRETWTWLAKNGILSIPRYKYDIYFANDDTMLTLRGEIGKWKSSKSRIARKIKSLLRIKVGLGKPDVTKFHSPKYSLDSQKLSLDIKPIIQKWSDIYFEKNKLAFGRGVLVVTMETESQVTKQCLKPFLSKPRLLLVSLDKRQCPIPPPSNDIDDVNLDDIGSDSDKAMKRRKRDVEEQEKRRRRRRKGRGRKQSRTRVVNPFTGPRQFSDQHVWLPDSNQTRLIRRSHTRAVRSTICRRHPMYVTFDDVGWSQWIIAPRGYQAYRCAGECPFPLGGKLNGTNHAVLLTMMHSVEPWSTPQPCCVPTALKPISLLYFDTDGGVVMRQYEDMVVSTCGCR